MAKTALDYRREYIEQIIKPAMKERKLSGSLLARRLGVSPSQVNTILRGDYPYRGAWHWTRYIDEYFIGQLGLPEFTAWYYGQKNLERVEGEATE